MIRWLRLKTEANAFVPAINEEETFLLTFFKKEQPRWNFYAAVAENRERNCRVSTNFSNRHGLYISIFSFLLLQRSYNWTIDVFAHRVHAYYISFQQFNFLTYVTGKWSVRPMISSRIVEN